MKVAVGVVAVAALGFLFMRSVRDSLHTPYTIQAGQMREWTLAIDMNAGPAAPLLLLQPPPALARDLFGQVFKRVMESMQTPVTPSIPLLLRREFEVAFAGHTTPEALLEAARSAGLEAAAFQPHCLAHRRVSDPTANQQLYFVIFDAPAFLAFRQRLSALATGDGTAAAGFDPAALSPVLFIAVSESSFARWLPLRADAARDCVTPIVIH